MKELIENINDKSEKMNEMKNKANEIELTNNELINKNKNLEIKNKEYKDINKELKVKLEESQNEVNVLKTKKKELELLFNEKKIFLKNKINELNNTNENIIKKSNENINSICDWTEKYLYKKEQNIKLHENNISNISFKLFNEKNKKEENIIINFEKLMKELERIRIKIIEDINIEKGRRQKEKEENEFNNNNYIKQYNDLKNEINKLYNKILEEIKKNKIFDYKEEKNKESNINDIEKIINECIKYMNEFAKDKQNKENINIMKKILKKKIKNLETNIDLKQMEINSLQEIIERRENINTNNSQNIDDFLNSTDNSLNSQLISQINYNITK